MNGMEFQTGTMEKKHNAFGGVTEFPFLFSTYILQEVARGHIFHRHHKRRSITVQHHHFSASSSLSSSSQALIGTFPKDIPRGGHTQRKRYRPRIPGCNKQAPSRMLPNKKHEQPILTCLWPLLAAPTCRPRATHQSSVFPLLDKGWNYSETKCCGN